VSDLAETAGAPPRSQAERVLEGGVDAHVHAGPFINGMMMVDVFELARDAAALGLGAVVVKNYFGSSCAAAALANRYAGGATVLGGVTLNWSAGGFNADAVRVAAHEGYDDGFRPGRVVWMPERAALNRARLLALDPATHAKYLSPFPDGDTSRPMLPEAREVLDVIAEEDLVLATSHLGPEESLAMFEVARASGVERLVVTHASNPGVGWTLEQKQRAVELGALIEEAVICWEPAMAVFHYTPTDAATEIFAAMRTIGPEHYILASDCGFHVAPRPAEAMRIFAALLLGFGFGEHELRAMAVDNPRRLLRLDEPDPRPAIGRDALGN
jgi:hypothetical protein